MYFKHIKSFFGRNYHNSRGWNTNRKIVVFESDDWGSIRMPSKEVYEHLLNKGVNVDKDPFTRYDSLASEDDLSALFDILTSFRDIKGNSPVITANSIMANPDFDIIKNDNYNSYSFEVFTKTLSNYKDHEKSFSLWKEGIHHKIFYPQLHGREHLNVKRWMKDLKLSINEVMVAFDNNMFGLSSNSHIMNGKSYMAAFDIEEIDEIPFIKESLYDAKKIFFSNFGYNSDSFIAPNYTWSNEVENIFNDINIKYIQSSRKQVFPVYYKKKKIKNKKHYIGEKNELNQIYLVRNCIFEPSLPEYKNPVEETLQQIKTSFFWKKPAIISTHRLNYIGFIDEKNRIKNLKYLKKMLKQIVKKWPDVEFMTSKDLGDLISNDN